MKREGRQRGIVRNYNNKIFTQPSTPNPNFNPNCKRFTDLFDSPSTVGLFTKVSSKPTNHSKFTGKCGKSRCAGCHVHPSCKSKDKGKGTHKLRSCDVAVNHRLISWRVVDNGKGYHGFNSAGISATEFLGQLSNYYHSDRDAEDDDDDVGNHYAHDGDDLISNDVDDLIAVVDGVVMRPCHVVEEIVNGVNDIDGGDNNDDMGFCDVGFLIEQLDGDGDEDWCLVGEL